jgi:SpoVK/Ycf46/Vps4 family AAA+-type ATPase
MRREIARGLLLPWRTVLLFGPPGNGKYSLVKAVATEGHRTLLSVSPGSLRIEGVVDGIFTVAEEMGPSVIYFEDIEAVVGVRAEQETSRRVRGQLATKLEALADDGMVFVLAGTTAPWDLDEALLRRFSKRIYVPIPDRETRKVVLEMNLRDLADGTLDIEEWADRLEGYGCADIAAICRDAAQLALDEDSKDDDWLRLSLSDSQIVITGELFQNAALHRKNSADPATLQRYEEFRRTRGVE